MDKLEGYSVGEIKFLIENEMVTRLDDLFLRRTKTAWVGKLSEESLIELGVHVSEIQGWTEDHQKHEKERALRMLREKHAVKI